MVQLFVHLHDGDACLSIARKNGVRNRRRPSVPRQQRSMDIDHSVARNRQHRHGDDLPVRDDNHHVRQKVPQSLDGLGIANAFGLEHLHTKLLRSYFDRRSRQSQASTRGPIRLRDHQLDFEPGLLQRFE